MDSKFNFDLLFKKTKTIDYKSLEVFKKAALLYQVNPVKDLKEFDAVDTQTFKNIAFKNSDGSYRLKKEDRMAILKDTIGINNIQDYINKYQVNTTYSNVLLMSMETNTINIKQLSNEEVFYAILLSELFPRKLPKDELKGIYQRRQFFKQFERITKNFAGRSKELKRVNDYVDWLPKSNIVNKISSTFRNIINWHEKPPLLIKGIGGIGKSTIVAKFIMDQNGSNEKGNLPFVYIDFDLPGFTLKEPMTILIEALRQINIQYPIHKDLINRVSEQISSLILSDNENVEMIKSTNTTTRNYIYGTIEGIIKNNNLDFKTIGKKPILVVFDSFEEMQYRASSTELFTFYQFISEISEKFPRIRPIFVGRSELYIGVDNFKFDLMEIKEFDADSANSLLEKTGVSDKETRNFIYDNFGGNPLMLTLATDLAKRDGGFNFKNKEEIKGKKWQYLVRRILGHIHDDDVRKIAVPGMLVRYLNPEVIIQVLAEPTKLGFTDRSKAEKIYEELRKEVSLISKSSDGESFSFRQDLRMTCESMILENYPEESKAIRENAINYYSNYEAIEDLEERKKHQAEYFFHLLKKEVIPEKLDASTFNELRPYLEHSIIELPASSRRFIDSLSNQNSSEETVNESNISNDDWEQYNLGLVKDALNGEFAFLGEVYEKLRQNNKRVNNGFSEFGKYEALVYQRLNKIQLSREFINRALQKATVNKNKNLKFELQLIQIQNFEYEERYKDALSLCNQIKKDALRIGKEIRKKYEFLLFRLENRLEHNRPINDFQEFVNTESFYAKEDYRDTKWEFIFNKLKLDAIQFKKHFEFNSEYRKLRKDLNNIDVLEGYAKKNLDFFLKDITNTGHFNIVLRDVLFAKEIMDSNLDIIFT
ncbi:NACHT domain-containing protein [Lutibacter citreus]|uniref:hypothetical protein n=1 Tax=Lutibacter citreus TaxID=2138210 RepID=UPI000DBE3615|nr:hypothetical protein [Lutibacter citreus]